ncbi:hypothetical protein J4218_02230 [Candidatus Pacearchaeota archaeon]|nr:hypothetical protein [uncultured archaeon]MBS3078916.1 hypothetical protein [Candidatus Pacearchaeota archaeon]
MDNKYELLKVKYENTRTWLLLLVALALSMSIGYYSVDDIVFKNQLAWTTRIVVIAIIILFIFQTIKYNKVLKYLAK